MENFFIAFSVKCLSKESRKEFVKKTILIKEWFRNNSIKFCNEKLFSNGNQFIQKTFDFYCDFEDAIRLFKTICNSDYTVSLFKRWDFNQHCEASLEFIANYEASHLQF